MRSAFPQPISSLKRSDQDECMSLRQWYAGQALSLIGNLPGIELIDEAAIARTAFKIADAMIKEGMNV